MKITLNEKILSEFDKECFSPRYENIFLRSTEIPPSDEYPFWLMNRYHRYYRILGYFSTLFNDKILVDIGTRRGHSVCSLAFNKNNTVYTYNIVNEIVENDAFSKFNNIKPFVLHNVDDTPLGNILSREEHLNIVLSSDLIFMDTDPHDGVTEKHLFDFLLKNNYKGITLWDDIRRKSRDEIGRIKTSGPNSLGLWWDEVVDNPNIKCYDITEYSWKSGTGVICFGEQEIILE